MNRKAVTLIASIVTLVASIWWLSSSWSQYNEAQQEVDRAKQEVEVALAELDQSIAECLQTEAFADCQAAAIRGCMDANSAYDECNQQFMESYQRVTGTGARA